MEMPEERVELGKVPTNAPAGRKPKQKMLALFSASSRHVTFHFPGEGAQKKYPRPLPLLAQPHPLPSREPQRGGTRPWAVCGGLPTWRYAGGPTMSMTIMPALRL